MYIALLKSRLFYTNKSLFNRHNLSFTIWSNLYQM